MLLGFSSSNPRELEKDSFGLTMEAMEPRLQGFLVWSSLRCENVAGEKTQEKEATLPDCLSP